MSFREIKMQDVREVLRRRQAGQSARRIARETGLDRKTVGRYLDQANEHGLELKAAVTDEIAGAVGKQVQARPLPPPSEAWQTLTGRRAQIEAWLEGEPPLRLVRVHELLAREGVAVGYTTLRRFASRELGWRKQAPTVRLDDPPLGQEAQIDFGLMGTVTDPGGKPRRVWALIVTLSSSRYMHVWPTFTQTVEDVCAGLDAAWRFFGGVPKHIILDNASSMVVRASKTDPTLNRAFRDYTDARHVFADTARVRHPRDKARVENQVPYVRERWFAGEVFTADLTEIRRHAQVWCCDVAGARVHGTTRQVPRDVYNRDERSQMQPAPATPFDVPHWSEPKVHPDHHVQVLKALYSVPTRYIGKVLDARADRSSVRLYLGTELIKVHPRKAAGQRSTDPNDFPPGKAAWALRDVDAVLRSAREQGAQVGAFAERLLGGPVPWIKLRQAYQLLRLCDRYGQDRVNALCARALAFGVIDVPRLEGMLKDARKTEDAAVATGRVIALPARFARDVSAFATRIAVVDHGQHTDGQDGGER
jgi:transposase